MFTYFETYGLWFSWYRFLSFSRFFLAFLTVSHSFPLVVSPYLSSSFVCSKRHQIKSYQHCTSRSIPWKSPETKKIIEKTKKRTDKKKANKSCSIQKAGSFTKTPENYSFFVFVVFSTAFFLLSWVFCWLCTVSHFAAFPIVFSAFCRTCWLYFGCWKASDALADSTCSCQWKIAIQCKDAFYVNSYSLRSLNFRGGSFFSLYKKYFRSLWESLRTSYTH